MLINNSKFDDFLNNANSFNGFLVYGPDKGQVRHRAYQIIRKLKGGNSLEIVKVSLEDLEKNSFLDLVNQTNIFSNKLIINLDLDLDPVLNLDLKFFSTIASSSSNFVLLEGGNLKKNNVLVKNFSLENKLACIPCYHDTDNTIKYTIKKFSEKLNLIIDSESINYLSQKLGSDKLLTLQEIKKLSIYGNGNKVSYNDVLISIGDSSLITINKICDNLFNSDKAPYFFDKIIDAGYNNIVVIRSLLNHFHFLLTYKVNDSKDINKIKNYIHFSRYDFIKKQLQLLNTKKINSIISEIFKLEKECKLEYNISSLLIRKFLISYSVL